MLECVGGNGRGGGGSYLQKAAVRVRACTCACGPGCGSDFPHRRCCVRGPCSMLQLQHDVAIKGLHGALQEHCLHPAFPHYLVSTVSGQNDTASIARKVAANVC